MSGSSLTNTQLRRILRQISGQIKGPIHPEHIESISHLSFELFVSKFGSLAQACLEAGCEYEVKTPNPEVYAAGADDTAERTQLIEDLRHIVVDQELQPSIETYNSYGRDQYDSVTPLFGSWPAAVLEAGLDATEIPGYASPQTVTAELQRLADQIGSPPSYEFAVEHSGIQSEVFDSRFPSWDVALQSAELDPERIDTTREYISELEILAAALGHRPNDDEIELYFGRDTLSNLRRQFGSVVEVLATADVPEERDLTPAGSLGDPADGTAEIPPHTDLLRDIFTVKRRYSAGKEDLDSPEKQREAFEDRGIIAEKHYDAQFGSLEAAFKYASQLDPRKFRRYRRELPDDPPELLRHHAVELAEILDRRPLIDEVVALTDHSLEQYLEAFSSWDAVFEDESVDAEFVMNPVLDLSNAELIESIEEVGASIGRPPTPDDYRDLGLYPFEIALRRYGSWPAALRTVGVDVDPQIPPEYLATDLTRETVHRAAILTEKRFDHEAVLVDDLYRVMGDLGRVPDWDDVQNFGAWPVESYKTTFGDPSDAIPNPGIERDVPNPLEAGRMRSQLIADLKTVDEMSDDTVWPWDVAFFGRYSIPSYLGAFETLQDVFVEAGLDVDHLPQEVTSWGGAWDPIFENARIFLDALREKYREIDEAPTMAEMREAGTSAQQCYEYYDTWREALQAAGIPPEKRSPRTSGTKDELIAELQTLADELGYPPKTTDIDAYGDFGLSSYYNFYPNWQSALEDAGLATSTASATVTGDESGTEEEPTSDIVNQLLSDIEETFEEDR